LSNYSPKPICIIPARSGSKRIKNKNLLSFFGKPIIYYSIKAAINSKIFSRIIVTTDSLKIARVAQKFGAEVPFLRSKKLSNDKTGIKEVICDCINKIGSKNIKYHFILYATNPLIKASYLKLAYAKILKTKCNFLLGVKKFETYPYKALTVSRNKIFFKFKKQLLKNSQRFQEFYYDDGSFTIFKTRSYLRRKYFFSNNSTFFLHQNNESFDLNTKEDLKILKKIYLINRAPKN
jgi:pseudaminic acid cytidylyltransferase